MNDAVALARLSSNSSSPFFTAVVSELLDDSHVNIDFSGSPTGVSCSSGYINRAVNDVVCVARTSGGLLVLGKVASADVDLSGLASIESVADDVEELKSFTSTLDDYTSGLETDIDRLEGITPSLRFGLGSAPTGYLQADTVWFRDAGGGRVDLYLRRATDPGTPTQPPTKSAKPTKPPKPKAKPKPVTITPAWRGAFRANGQTDTHPKQGAWTGSNWSGGWGFESRVQAACSGKTVAKMTFVLSRAKSGGVYGKSNMNLYLFDRSTKGAPTSMGGSVVVKMEPGGKRTWTLPTSWRNSLANGSAKGIMIKASGRADYLITDSRAGSLRIEFS